jgi:hypothetical protein
MSDQDKSHTIGQWILPVRIIDRGSKSPPETKISPVWTRYLDLAKWESKKVLISIISPRKITDRIAIIVVFNVTIL